MTSESDHEWRGSLSETPRVNAVREHFATAGVPTAKLGFVDSLRPSDRKYWFTGTIEQVTVWEVSADADEDMNADEFGAYMSACNSIVNGNPENRWLNDDETRIAIDHEYIDTEIMSKSTDPAEAGQNLDEPTDDNTADISTDRLEVHHNGGDTFTVYDPSVNRGYRVNLGASQQSMVMPLAPNGEIKSVEKRMELIGAVVTRGAEYRESPSEHLSVTVESPSTGNASASDSNDSASGDQSESEDASGAGWEQTTALGEFDASALSSQVTSWIERAAEFKTALDPDAIEVEAGTWDGQPGLKIESTPFPGGYHDGDSWQDQDGYEDHQEAFREIMSDEDGIEWYGEPDYLNFLPAGNVDSVTQ